VDIISKKGYGLMKIASKTFLLEVFLGIEEKKLQKDKKIILNFTRKLPAWKIHELAEMKSDAQILKCQISVRS
jgi:hypothetical protein